MLQIPDILHVFVL